MTNDIQNDEDPFRNFGKIDDQQSIGRHRFELSRSAVFLPLEMIEQAIRYRVKALFQMPSGGITWSHAYVVAERPATDTQSRYRNSNADQMIPDSPETRRKIQVTASGHCTVSGGFRVKAVCELYRHEANGSGWESGAVMMEWKNAYEQTAEKVLIQFRHFYEGGDAYATVIQQIEPKP